MKYQFADNKERSKPHRRLEKCLEDIGIAFKSEEYFSPYTVDIYISEWHIAIEADGPFHSKSKDKVRDRYLMEMYGLSILRLDMRLWHSKNWLKDKITEFIEHEAESGVQRKVTWLTWLAHH